MESLKLSSERVEMKVVCKTIDMFRSEEIPDSNEIDDDLKYKLIELLTDEKAGIDDFHTLLATSTCLKNFFMNKIFQETLTFATKKLILMVELL